MIVCFPTPHERMKHFAVAFLVLFALMSLASAQSVGCDYCNKVTNATECANTGGNMPNGQALVKAWEEARQALALKANSDGADIEACIDIWFNHICLVITSEDWTNMFSNVTIEITVDHFEVWSTTVTMPELMSPAGLCLDDNTVIEILMLIPSLRDDLLAFLKFLEITGCEPRGLFSLCLLFDPCEETTSDDPTCGCFTLDFQLLYWRDYCALKETAFLGCIGNATETEAVKPWDNKPMNTFRL